MNRQTWAVDELRAILAGLAVASAGLPEAERRGFAQALASMAASLGLSNPRVEGPPCASEKGKKAERVVLCSFFACLIIKHMLY